MSIASGDPSCSANLSVRTRTSGEGDSANKADGTNARRRIVAPGITRGVAFPNAVVRRDSTPRDHTAAMTVEDIPQKNASALNTEATRAVFLLEKRQSTRTRRAARAMKCP